MTPIRVVEWTDLQYTLLWGGEWGSVESSDTWMNWVLVPQFGTEGGKVVYERRDRSNGAHTTELPTEATPECHGFIKWDGCMQVCGQEDGAVTFHFDERSDIERLAEAFQRVRDLMRQVAGAEVDGR